MELSLGIVGGGAAAASLLDTLSRQTTRRISVTLFEPAKQLGPGKAYQSDTDIALLNRQAGLMSLRAADPTHFLRWVNAQPSTAPAAGRDDFLPRRVFGEYLTANVDRVFGEFAETGRPVRLVEDAVVDVRESRRAVTVRTAGGGAPIRLDQVVLCTGTGGPVDVYGLRDLPGYVHDPYPLWTALDGVGATGHVLVLGTGLTAVDAALTLLRQGHRGRITMASRRGLLPAVRAFAPPVRLRHLEAGALRRSLAISPVMSCARVLALLRAELRSARVDPRLVAPDLSQTEDPGDRLERQLGQAAAGVNTWQPILVQSVLESIGHIWQAMPADERDRFMARWHQVFNSVINPMPPPTAARLLEAVRAGQLDVRRGLRSVTAGFTAETAAGPVRADVVVNAIRQETGVTHAAAAPLVDGLIGAGSARAHSHGGLDVVPESGRVLDRAGVPSARLFALGQLTSGVHYYTSSMTMIVKRAARIAEELHGGAR